MYVTVFGLGRTGTVTAAMLAHLGHNVYGVDVDLDKLALLQLGRVPFHEPELGEYVHGALEQGRLTITTDGTATVQHSDLSLVAVGVPLCSDGSSDLSAVYNVLEVIGRGLRKRDAYHVVALRHPVPVMELDKLILHLEIKSGRQVGDDVGFGVNPTFMRQGCAIADFLNPPFVLIGQEEARAGAFLRTLYNALDAPFIVTDYRTAMLTKYITSAWHALKVTFANEVARLADALRINPDDVMDIVKQDTVLNISTAYLDPNGPYGGAYLGKELAVLLRTTAVRVPMLAAITESNAAHIALTVDRILSAGAKRIGMVGLSYKCHTDDLRDSPWVAVVEALFEANREVRIYDPDVSRVAAGPYRSWMIYDFEELKAWAEYVYYAKPELVSTETKIQAPGAAGPVKKSEANNRG